MTNASTLGDMSPELLRVVERAQREPEGRFHSLAHLIDAPALERAYRRMRKSAAVGVDGMTKEKYGRDLEVRLQDLHDRLKSKRYRHQPIRRVHIPKGQGKTRPIGISAFEDKLVQDVLREVLEADIVSFFDRVDRTALVEMLQTRVADGSLLRLIGKCLHVGVFDGEEFSRPEIGTAQGSVLSPILGNVYLHHVLDLWFETEVKPRMRGRATLIRYCDDFIIGFEREGDARRAMEVLGKRLGRFGLSLHPDKTRLVPFRRPPEGQQSGKGPATFDFLGFTFYWLRSRSGRWRMGCKTRSARLRRAIQLAYDWCRRQRHQPIEKQHAALTRRLRGHFNYFGVNDNTRSLELLVRATERSWYKWLHRRSQRGLTWESFAALLKRFPLPQPRVTVQIWDT